MKITLLSLNCSYSHTSLAHPFIRAFCDCDVEAEWFTVEATTKEKTEEVLAKLLATAPDILLATFYIFNHNEVAETLSRFKKLSPQTTIIGGGPEFLGNNEKLLRQYDWLDMVIRGEGELPLRNFFQSGSAVDVPGFCYFQDGKYVDFGVAGEVQQLDDIPSPYKKGYINLSKPFIQLETSRGCPNDCGFCTSSIGCGVRYYSLERVHEDLKIIEASGIKEIRILDRTFNDNITRANKLLTMFREEFPALRFHCEFDPAFVTPALTEELKKMPSGQLHLELGVQTFSEESYKKSGRKSSIQRTVNGLKILCELENVEVHSDLIAGLPGVSLNQLYDDLLKMLEFQPEEIQLENLKLLPGTPFAENPDLVGAGTTPYEILYTSDMSFADLAKSRDWSKMVDWYYNRPGLKDVFTAIMLKEKQNFADFHHFLSRKGAFSHPLNPEKAFTYLVEYCQDESAIWDTCWEQLAIAWYLSRYSPEHGLFPAKAMKEDPPENLTPLAGEMEMTECKRIFKYENKDAVLYIGYSKGHIKSPNTKVTIWK